jgi:NAD(P)-dependent dehydrogenase (short-subunit alcohol dehydrogenase family)
MAPRRNREVVSALFDQLIAYGADGFPELGKPDDVGAVVAFLASPLSFFVPGANWRVDGGSITSIN